MDAHELGHGTPGFIAMNRVLPDFLSNERNLTQFLDINSFASCRCHEEGQIAVLTLLSLSKVLRITSHQGMRYVLLMVLNC